MPDAPFVVRRILSELTVVFEGDQPIANLPVYVEHVEAFAEKFKFAQVGLSEATGHTLWSAEKGTAPIGEEQLVRIATARGNELVLTALVEGETSHARAVISALWAFLVELAQKKYPGVYGGTAKQNVEQLGRVLYSTTAVIDSPVPFSRLFPVLEKMHAFTQAAPSREWAKVQNPTFRASVEVRALASGPVTTQKLTFEPRLNTDPRGHHIFTQSPLTSDEHLRMVELVLKG